MPIRAIGAALAAFILGMTAGGYVFSESLPRSFLAVDECQTRCLGASELAGLLVSVGIQRAAGAIPSVEAESDECIAIRHPRPQAPMHFVLFPKYDIKNIGSVPKEGGPFVLGCLAMIRELTLRHRITSYRVVTYGPDSQNVTYLHFHLLAGGPSLQ